MAKITYYLTIIVAIFYGVVSQNFEDIANSNTTSEPTTSWISTSAPPSSDNKVNITLLRGSGSTATICFRLIVRANFSISYVKKDGSMGSALIKVPSSAHVDSNTKCNAVNATSQIIIVQFDNGISVRMAFNLLDSSTYALTNLSLTYLPSGSMFPDSNITNPITVNALYSDLRLKATKGGYYACNSDLDVKLDKVNLTTQSLQVQAFVDDAISANDFHGTLSICSADATTDNIVPIAVGAALAGLIVIVLIAYIIGRQRNRSDYQSM